MTFGTLTVIATPGISDSGQAVRISIAVFDQTGALVAPATLTLTFNNPDGTTSNVVIGSLVLDSTGNYHYDYLPAVTGLFHGTAVATVPNAAGDFSFEAAASGDSTAWQPTSAEVAAMVAHLTIDATGIPTGNFSATTIPSAAQVAVLVHDIAGEIAATAGVIPPLLYDDAKFAAILGAAGLIEDSFENGNDQLATLYANRYTLALARLTTAVAQVTESGQVEPAGNPPQPLFSFPDLCDATTVNTIW